jgi:hypothetical protein
VRDLAILVPSRGRPQSVARLIAACELTCRTDYALYFAFDEDDPQLAANRAAAARAFYQVGERRTLAEWTNKLYDIYRGGFRYFASLGDDHVPLTDGWDARLCAALGQTGGGFAYCNNGHQIGGQRNLPEMCVISANVLEALGWVCEPDLAHYFVDNVWRDLGEQAGCLHYLDDVIVEHRHWSFGTTVAPADDTYFDNQAKGPNDRTAYEVWRADRMSWDVAKVKGALGNG